MLNYAKSPLKHVYLCSPLLLGFASISALFDVWGSKAEGSFWRCHLGNLVDNHVDNVDKTSKMTPPKTLFCFDVIYWSCQFYVHFGGQRLGGKQISRGPAGTYFWSDNGKIVVNATFCDLHEHHRLVDASSVLWKERAKSDSCWVDCRLMYDFEKHRTVCCSWPLSLAGNEAELLPRTILVSLETDAGFTVSTLHCWVVCAYNVRRYWGMHRPMHMQHVKVPCHARCIAGLTNPNTVVFVLSRCMQPNYQRLTKEQGGVVARAHTWFSFSSMMVLLYMPCVPGTEVWRPEQRCLYCASGVSSSAHPFKTWAQGCENDAKTVDQRQQPQQCKKSITLQQGAYALLSAY